MLIFKKIMTFLKPAWVCICFFGGLIAVIVWACLGKGGKHTRKGTKKQEEIQKEKKELAKNIIKTKEEIREKKEALKEEIQKSTDKKEKYLERLKKGVKY